MTYDFASETVDVRGLKLRSVPALATDTGHPVIDIGEFEEAQSENYPMVFHVDVATVIDEAEPTDEKKTAKLRPRHLGFNTLSTHTSRCTTTGTL